MIKSIRHKGLRNLYDNDSNRGIHAAHAEKIRRVLARLDAAKVIADMDMPGFRLHPLKGKFSGFYAVTVQANWRIIFQFNNGDATAVDYIDYH